MVIALAGMAALAASNKPKLAAVIDLAIVNIGDSFEIRPQRQAHLRENLVAERTDTTLYSDLEPHS